jgi:hypothetical protein
LRSCAGRKLRSELRKTCVSGCRHMFRCHALRCTWTLLDLGIGECC